MKLYSNKEQKSSQLLDKYTHYFNTPEIRIKTTDEKKWNIINKVKEYVKQKNYEFIDIDGVRVLGENEYRADVTVFLGTIDNSYRGEIGIMVKNECDFPINIPKFTKLAQGVLEKITHCEFELVEELDKTERGTGGYGSSGVTI